MGVDRTAQRVAGTPDRRRVATAAVSRPRVDTGASAAGALQRRLGNVATQSIIARSIANTSGDGDTHAEALYQLSKLGDSLDRPEIAGDARDTLRRLFAGSHWLARQ